MHSAFVCLNGINLRVGRECSPRREIDREAHGTLREESGSTLGG